MIRLFSQDVFNSAQWAFEEVSKLAYFLWNDTGWVGVCVIGLPLVYRVVNIVRKLF